MSRVALSNIRSLTLYKGELTQARRLPPVAQLTCVGKACKLFQPDVVRCYNNGGSGTDIDWTCEADLPEKLRFGRIDVSCEGWAHPGDPYVLKGSCGLEYRLVNISDKQDGWFQNFTWSDFLERGFVYLAILLVFYLLFQSYIWRFIYWLKRSFSQGPSRPSSSRPSEFYSSGRPRPPDYPPPPPPYSEPPKSYWSSWQPGWGRGSYSPSSGPGFWSGLGLGSLGGLAASRMFGGGNAELRSDAPREYYDWERERRGRGFGGLFGSSWSSPGVSSSPRTHVVLSSTNGGDRGEGPSNLGSVRRSRGYGVTNVR